MKTLPFLLLLASTTAFAELPTFLKECEDCHGKDGVSKESDVPTIAGNSANFLAITFKDYLLDRRPAVESKYRAGDTNRPKTDMKKIAKGLTEAQIKEMGQYYSKKPFVAAQQAFDEKLVKKGENIHKKRCEKCHADGGSSAEDDSGLLAGQQTAYLKAAINHYRKGERRMEEKMEDKMKKVDDGDIEALLNFWASQQ